jgi:Flp pilus assembly protein TadG
MSRSLRHRRDDQGVVALELVLAMPMIVALIVTIIMLAGLFQTKSRVVGAARDGARVLAIKPGATPNPDANATDGITVVLEGSACPALTNPAYQSATPPQVTARASRTYTVTVPFVGSWTKDVIERVKMPCG